CDAFRKPQRFLDMLQAVECDLRGRTGFQDQPFPQHAWLADALVQASMVDGGAVAARTKERYPQQPEHIPLAIREQRIANVSTWLASARLKSGENIRVADDD